MADAVARGLSNAGTEPLIVRLRDFEITACMGCNYCACNERGFCILKDKDQCEELFAKLLAAPAAVFASPIYFYHLPAGFKAWIDRGQSYYMRREKGDPAVAGRSGLPARVCLVAGRPRGQKLFEGSLLTLKYFLRPFGFEIGDSLTFRGKDAPGELVADHEAVRSLEALGRDVARTIAGD
jgi:multimeric flavodoxin WrbA